MKNRDVIDNLLANHHLPEIAAAARVVAEVRAEFAQVEARACKLSAEHSTAAEVALRFAVSQDCASADRAAYVAEAAEHFALSRRLDASRGYSTDARRISEEKRLVEALKAPRIN
jgi:hypothetical protein